MNASLPPKALAYFSVLHEDDAFLGVADAHARHARELAHHRSAYRWRARYLNGLVAFPTFSVERLGLVHVHLFVIEPRLSWVRFPFAVEQTWMTEGFTVPVLYLHCIVPREHLASAAELVGDLKRAGWCARFLWVPAGAPWQEAALESARVRERAPPETGRSSTEDLLRSCPLVVPAIFEAWGVPASLPGLWERARNRLGHLIRRYVRRRVRIVNGKSHARDAYIHLADAKLFRQNLLRGPLLLIDGVELFLVLIAGYDRVQELIEACRSSARVIEGSEPWRGRTVLRLTGPTGMIDAVIGALREFPRNSARVFVTNRHAQERERERPRFCYEFLFDPKTGGWVFPRDRIMEHLSR